MWCSFNDSDRQTAGTQILGYFHTDKAAAYNNSPPSLAVLLRQ